MLLCNNELQPSPVPSIPRKRTSVSAFRKAFAVSLALILSLGGLPQRARSEAILQYFGTSWNEIATRMPELAEAGYSALWLPPPFKGTSAFDVGFGTFDRFDLGSKDQMGSVSTKYGTASDLIRMIETAHRFGIRVYFDNVMAHNGGPIPGQDENTSIYVQPGFVPEDFHLQVRADGSYHNWPGIDWGANDLFQIWNRNPFGIDIAQEDPNTSFGANEGDDFPKYTGIRHPNNPEYYSDLDLPIDVVNSATGIHFNVYNFANKEPFEDVGVAGVANSAGNGKFDFVDTNSNGQHDVGELSEPFTDTGIDPTNPGRQTAAWGFGDAKYNMGNPVSEDVNSMLFRAVRWFIDVAKVDGFRLDAVKHVPDYFFGKQSGADKDYSDWGYCGQIQAQFNITHGYSDWNNHRDSSFNTEQGRDDAMMFGEHLGAPPGQQPYLDAGMRVSTDNFLNAIKEQLGSGLWGLDQAGYASFGGVGGGVIYCMSHDNNYIWSGHLKLAHATLLTRAGLPIVYTDGFHHAGAPDYFPKPSYVPFLGEFGQSYLLNQLYLNQQFARGDQIAKWSNQNFVAYERRDKSENGSMSDADGTVLLFMMARSYGGSQPCPALSTTFPIGAPLYNYSADGGGFYAYPRADGKLYDQPTGGNVTTVPDGGYFAFSWRSPEQPDVNPGKPAIEILQNGQSPATLTYLRKDGPDGDPNFNPYGVSGATAGSYSYPWTVPLITSGSNLSFLARADGSAENIRLKLDGGVDLNSQMTPPLGPTTGEKRDNPPALSTDVYLGYEQMRYVQRVCDKFAAKDTSRNIIGSIGAETYQATIGTPGFTINNGSGYNSGTGTATYVYHNPAFTGYDNPASQLQFTPAPQSAAGQSIDVLVKTGYQFQINKVYLYYTTDGVTYPEGYAGTPGNATTQVVAMVFVQHGTPDGSNVTDWWKGTLPSLPSGTVLRYKIGAFNNNAASVFPSSQANIALKKKMETRFEITNFNATTGPLYPHNDYGVLQAGLSEGFHILRARQFLKREIVDQNNNTFKFASIYNTVSQTFYYDAQLPQGEVKFPAENDSVGGQQYGVVVRTDPSVTEVWYNITDSDPQNNDSATSVANGNGAWVKATQLTPTIGVSSAYPNEWRFNYNNIPSGGQQATIQVRLRELSSGTNMALSDAAGHYTTIMRHVNAWGPDTRVSVAWPQADGDTVGSNYVMKVWFSKSLADGGLSDQDLINRFLITIASSESGSPTNPVVQARAGYSINRNINNDFHELACTLPNLYNGVPNFLHTIKVTHTRPSPSPQIVATRLVKAYPIPQPPTNNITEPPEFDSSGAAYVTVLPDVANPTAAQRSRTIRVETDTNATSVAINFTSGPVNPADVVFTSGSNPTVTGDKKYWEWTWGSIAQGNYQFSSTVTTSSNQSAVASRSVRVVYREMVIPDSNDVDDDDDGLSDSIETTATLLSGTSNGNVHLNLISGKTDPLIPDSDGDGLPDGLESGWATAMAGTDTNTDTNGDGQKNFISDLDPPLFNTSDNASQPPGYGNFSQWPYNVNNSRTDQIAGTMTDPNKTDTDGDGLLDGTEDKNHNGRMEIGVPDISGTLVVIAHPITFYNTSRIDRSKLPSNAVILESDPNNPDTDSDLATDGAEDANGNGKADINIVNRNQTDGNGNFVVLKALDETTTGPLPWKYSDFTYRYTDASGDHNTTRINRAALNAVFRPAGLPRGDGIDVVWLETDPCDPDTDADGLPDGWEIAHGLDPLDDGVPDHYSMRTGKLIPDTAEGMTNGASGDPDGDLFSNSQEYINDTDPRFADTGVPPPPNVITIGPSNSMTVGSVTNNHEFTDWTANDIIAFDEYDGDGTNYQGSDVYHAYDNFDTSRDLVAFYAHDGGDTSAGGDGNFYFRVDLHDLQPYAENGYLDIYVAINFGSAGTGEKNLPDDVNTLTNMGWQAVVACYSTNNGRVYVDTVSGSNSTSLGQELTQFGVQVRDQNSSNGFKKAYYNSELDSVEFSISRDALLAAGWTGNAANLLYQVFTTKDGTKDSPLGPGDIGGRSDIRDSIYDDWIASDYYKDQTAISGAGSVLKSWFGLSTTNDRGKRIKVVSLVHSNHSFQPGSEIQSLINTAAGAGFYRPLDAHEAFNVPLTMHITPALASAIQWAKVDPNSTRPYRDGPALNTRIGNLMGSGKIDLLASTFSDHILPYYSKEFNRDNVTLANEFLTSIYHSPPSSQVFWTPERVVDTGVLDKVSDLGFSYTFVDQMRHLFKWFDRQAAYGNDGYRLNRINGVKCFAINDQVDGYLFQNTDNGLPTLLHELFNKKARNWQQDQVVIFMNDWENFTDKAKADAYDKNVRWMASHPWVQIVTPDQIASGQIDLSQPPDGAGDAFGWNERGTGLTLPLVAKDWIDHATQESYDNWYNGQSGREESLRDKLFNIRSGVAMPAAFGIVSGTGVAGSTWSQVLSTGTNNGTLSKLARGTIHAAQFETAFHDQTNNTLTKYSTGAYLSPDTTNQNLAGFSKFSQSQTRMAAIYKKVDDWANAARSGIYLSTAVAESADIDLDGEFEYLLYNDRIFAMFERIGGRMTNAWVRDISTGEVFQALGNPLSYSGFETEEEGDVHLDATSGQTAYRTSGFKDWFAQTGGPGVGNNSYVNNYFSVTSASNGWTFTSSDTKIARTITLPPRSSRIAAQYNLSGGVNTVYVRHGMSPNLYDLLTSGQANLSLLNDGTNGEVSVLDTTAQQRIVRSFVKYGGGYNASYISAAADRSGGSGL